MSFNEIDNYRTIQQTSNSELILQGYPNDAIAYLKSTSIESIVYTRAQLPVDRLLRMGYSDKEISILKAYRGEFIETDSAIYGLAGTLTADFSCHYATVNRYEISYHWSWDHVPFVSAIDAAGIRWVAISSDGLPVDTSAFSSSATITYTYAPGVSYDQTYYASQSNFSSEVDFNSLTCNFSITAGASSDPYHALSGRIYTIIQKDSSVTRDILYLKVCGVYGHSIINIGAPTVSYTTGDTSIGITFEGGWSIDNIGIKKYKIYTNRSMVAIDA